VRNAWILATAALIAAPAAVRGQDWRSITQMRQAGDEEQLRVMVRYGAGNLAIAPGSGGLLYKAALRYDAQAFQPELAYRDGALRVGLDDVRVRGRNLRAGELKLELGPTVPLNLSLEFGAARAHVDLTGLRIQRLRLATGASESRLYINEPNTEVCELVDLDVGAAKFDAYGLGNLNAQRLDFSGGVGDVSLDFTGEWRNNMAVSVKMGLGSLTLRVPRGLGVRVQKGGLLVGFDSQDLIKRGDSFYSENWESAAHQLTVDIEAAFGSIRIEWVGDGRR
jgi:hypothetical protein